ncbi:MAG: PAS domain S-box protein, partial [Microcoleus sp. CAN_BIN18]|nr:PAS domain S-box protein [Microcoleus sp. CAN_BIN18]
MQLLYYFFATTFTLTLPDLSLSLVAGIANCIICFCYFGIAFLISLGLWRNRQFGFDTFATVTAGIFWSCAFGHSGHAAEFLGLPHSLVAQTVSDWITVIPAIAFLSLSSRYSLLVGSTQILQSKKDTEQSLNETTQRFKAIFDQAFQLIAILEPDGTVLEANQTALELGNFQQSEVLGLKFWLTPWWASSPTNQQQLKANIQQVSAGKFVREEYEITGFNNQVTVIDVSFKPLLNEAGEVFQILAEGRDISQRKQTEAALQQLTAELEQRVNERTEQILETNTQLQHEIRDRTAVEQQLLRLKSILEATTDWVGMADAEGHSLYLNCAAREILHVDMDSDLAGVSISALTSPKSVDTIMNVGIPAACRDGVWSGETIWQSLDGEEIPVSQVIIAHKSETGELEFLSTIARNISNRKRTEQAMQQNLQMLDLASDAFIIRELDGTINYWNQGAERMYGFSRQEALGKATHSLFQTIFPKQPLAAISAQLEHQDYWEGELIHSTNHDTQITVFSRWTLQRDEQGNPKAVLETNNDITERKLAEIEKQRLIAIVENSSDFIGVGTLEGQSTYLNPAGMKLNGIKNLEEVRSKSILESFSKEDAKILAEEILPAVIRDGLWEGEFRLKHFQTDEIIPVDFTLFTLKDPETGEPIGLATVTRDIRDRKHAEEMLRDRERLFRAIFDQSFQLVGLLEPDGTVLEANQTALTVAGLGREDFIGTQFADNLWWQISPEAKQKVQAAVASAAAGEFVRYEADVLVAGGAVMTVDFSLKPIVDDNGKVVLLIPEARDISDRKALERELVLRQSRFDAFFAAAPASMFIFDDQLRFVQANESLAETTGVSVAEHLGKTVREVIPEIVDTLEPILQGVLANNEPLLNIEVSGTTLGQPGAIRDWLASYFPLAGEDGKPIGVGGVAIEITDRKKAEAERDRFFTLSLDLLCIADFKGNFKRLNPAWAKTLGYTVEELQEQSFLDFVHPEDCEKTLAETAKIASGAETISFENRYRCKDGSYKWLSWKSRPLLAEKIMYAVARDVTESKQAIAKLQETTAQLARSEDEFRGQSNLLQLLIDSIGDGIVAADEKGNFVLFNPAAEDIFGIGSTDTLPNEWSGKYGLFLPDQVTPYPAADIPLTRTIRGESVHEVELFTRHAGKPQGLWVKISGRPLKDETGAIKGGVVVCRNITQERASQQQMQQLAETQERLLQELKTRQNALDEAAIVSETDSKGLITYINDRFTQISGYSMGELLHRDHRLVNSGYHPKAFFAEMWLTISRGLVWKGEIKNRRKDGSFYWVDSTLAPIFDTSGTIVKYIAIRFDITERKQAEERLEKLAAERKAEADSMTEQVLKLLGEIKGAA